MKSFKTQWVARIAFLSLFMFCTCCPIQANNVEVSNVKLVNQNVGLDFTMVQFDIDWQNSWRISVGPRNWDAAWVFVKYRLNTQDIWQHATLNYLNGTGTSDGHIEPTNGNVVSSNDTGLNGAHGVFIHSTINFAQSSVNYQDVALRWNYGVDGLADGDSVEVAVFAVEMVYVREGEYSLGSGGSETDAFHRFPNTTDPYRVISGLATATGPGTFRLNYPGAPFSAIPATFPNGFDGFYCMKYEISQAQYVEFLNKLTQAQATTRYNGVLNGNLIRNGVVENGGVYSTTVPYVACGNLNWADVGAYLDWAALRPMSELEYEKACRGPGIPVANEYVWGTTSISTDPFAIAFGGAPNETISSGFNPSIGNANYNNLSSNFTGPVRVGIFSANANNTGRITSGSSFYGIMELGGNLIERVVSITNAFNATSLIETDHGDGAVDLNGDLNASSWPDSVGSSTGFKGGAYALPSYFIQTSDRSATQSNSPRDNSTGGRGVRSAPFNQ